ncbi:YihY/virulence factor BrkB family protein [Planosporangium thailandense]|uniref:YihY/virulence factor BrkB family protein n=2 Tax=Planosporangium thailandense TaxID=765197 RepID=A0ABX0Y765_9ACTN|nr:YihY/virulence factor BrkB family protein [Planosporangium thailandense]NJC73129.1 YihY/virulence factor BrkB family protein [Planosporangium thailandense]
MRRIDSAQRRSGLVAFAYAVFKKFGDDQAGNLAALLAYYAFVSIFPLLLAFTTVLGYLLRDNPYLQQRLVHSALVEFPVIGDQIRTAGLRGHWYVLVTSVLVSVWGAQGVATAAQNAFNGLWSVPYARRPGFPASLARSFGLLGVMGLAVLVTGLLSGVGGGTGSIGVLLRIAAFAVSAVFNIGIFLLGFRLATAPEVRFRDLAAGAVFSAVVWQALLAIGTVLVAHQIRHQQALYGTFGVVLGLLAWLHLQARLMLYAVEVDVVRARHLWPRSVVAPPLTRADRAAYRAYAESTRRRPADEQDVEVHFAGDAPTDVG